MRGRPLPFIAAAALILLAACRGGSAPPAGLLPSPTPETAISPLPLVGEGGNRLVRVVERVLPAVVNVTTDGGEGTGFIVDSSGIVVTNFHVVQGGFRIRVITADGQDLAARAIAGSQEGDLAILRVEPDGPLPTVPLGDSDELRLGQQVVALGFALGLEGGPSVTSGIVSAVGRTLEADGFSYEGLVQTDAAINRGNSGGPLVDLSGRVVGINSAGVRAAAGENIAFAIAINRAKPFIEHAIENPQAPQAFLGVSTQDVTPELVAFFRLPVQAGALVREVGGPAREAGIRAGDVIVAFEGQEVAGSEELGEMILEHQPGDEVEVTVVRPGGAEDTITATLGVRPLPAE